MKKRKKISVLWVILGSWILLGAIGFVVHGFWHPYRVPTGSMAPTIPEKTLIFANDWAYQSAEDVQRGEVIVFEPPPSPHRFQGAEKSTYVFRVVGLPGDTVAFDDQGGFVVNGAALEQTKRGDKVYEKQSEKTYEVALGKCRVEGEVEIEADSFFVAGDNRPNALDSRYWGVVPFELISGRARVD